MLTFHLHHSEPIVLEKVSKSLLLDVTYTIGLEQLRHVQVLHKSTRELDVFFIGDNKVVLILNLIGSLYKAEVILSEMGELEEMIMKFTKFTYQLKAYYPFKLTKAKTPQQALDLIDGAADQRNYDVDDYSQDDDYSQTGSDKFSLDSLTETLKRTASSRSSTQNSSPFRSNKKKRTDTESPFGSVGKIISFVIKAIIVLGLLRTCSERYGDTGDTPTIPQKFITDDKLQIKSDLHTNLASSKVSDGQLKTDWKSHPLRL